MKLAAGGRSSEEMNVHEKSDQVLLVIEGSVEGEIGGKKRLLQAGDVCLVPAGTPHRFQNAGQGAALTFNVYSPPEYSAGEKG
jgi:mannose-6-phosphate isomerase-like protein (cupin superfamily)